MLISVEPPQRHQALQQTLQKGLQGAATPTTRAPRLPAARAPRGGLIAAAVLVLLALCTTVALVQAGSLHLALFTAVLVNAAAMPLSHTRRLAPQHN